MFVAMPLRIELGRQNLAVAAGGVGEITDIIGEQQSSASKSVSILNEHDGGLVAMLFHRSGRFVDDCGTGRFGQISRPALFFGSLPHCVSL